MNVEDAAAVDTPASGPTTPTTTPTTTGPTGPPVGSTTPAALTPGQLAHLDQLKGDSDAEFDALVAHLRAVTAGLDGHVALIAIDTHLIKMADPFTWLSLASTALYRLTRDSAR